MVTLTPYNLISKNGNVVVQPQTLNTDSTSLGLAGRTYSGWGVVYAQNFLNLLENFSSNTAPDNPRKGQLWYDAGTGILKLYDGTQWEATSGDAEKLLNARNISLGGHATGSAAFDGSQDITIDVTLQNSGVTPGNYTSANITVDRYGRVTSAASGTTGNTTVAAVNTFNGRQGAVTLTYNDVVTALGFVPTANAGVGAITGQMVISALGYTPLNKAGDTMLGQLEMNYNNISHAGNVTAYGNLRMGTPGTQTDFQGNRLQNVGTPVASTDGATKGYVDSRIGGGGSGGNVTVSTSAPSGGSEGDVWYRY